MKHVFQLISEKEQQINQLNKEIEALRAVTHLLSVPECVREDPIEAATRGLLLKGASWSLVAHNTPLSFQAYFEDRRDFARTRYSG